MEDAGREELTEMDTADANNQYSNSTLVPEITSSSSNKSKENSVLNGKITKKRKTIVNKKKVHKSVVNTLNSSQAEEMCNFLSIANSKSGFI